MDDIDISLVTEDQIHAAGIELARAIFEKREVAASALALEEAGLGDQPGADALIDKLWNVRHAELMLLLAQQLAAHPDSLNAADIANTHGASSFTAPTEITAVIDALRDLADSENAIAPLARTVVKEIDRLITDMKAVREQAKRAAKPPEYKIENLTEQMLDSAAYELANAIINTSKPAAWAVGVSTSVDKLNDDDLINAFDASKRWALRTVLSEKLEQGQTPTCADAISLYNQSSGGNADSMIAAYAIISALKFIARGYDQAATRANAIIDEFDKIKIQTEAQDNAWNALLSIEKQYIDLKKELPLILRDLQQGDISQELPQEAFKALRILKAAETLKLETEEPLAQVRAAISELNERATLFDQQAKEHGTEPLPFVTRLRIQRLANKSRDRNLANPDEKEEHIPNAIEEEALLLSSATYQSSTADEWRDRLSWKKQQDALKSKSL